MADETHNYFDNDLIYPKILYDKDGVEYKILNKCILEKEIEEEPSKLELTPLSELKKYGSEEEQKYIEEILKK